MLNRGFFRNHSVQIHVRDRVALVERSRAILHVFKVEGLRRPFRRRCSDRVHCLERA